MLVRHRITGKQHTMPRAQYETQTGAKAVYEVIDDTDYVPDELKETESTNVPEEVNDSNADSKPADDKPAKAHKQAKAKSD